jgi:hypothetical protein
MESVVVVVLMICVFLSFYFTFLSFQTVDADLKRQILVFAVLSLVTGVVMMASLTIYLGVKRVFPRIDDQLKNNVASENDEK